MSEIDELVNIFNSTLRTDSSLNLDNLPPIKESDSESSDSESSDSNMVDKTNYPLLQLYVDTIPNFDGNPHILTVFLDACESLIGQFSDRQNNAATINAYILRAIIGKLTGRALSLIGSRSELTVWIDIKNLLILSFGDQRNLDCHVQDLIALHPFKNEPPCRFGMRCQDSRSLIVSKINASNFSPEEKRIRLQNYNDLALKTFIHGLTGQLQNNVRLRNPDSLEQAMAFVVEEENFLYSSQKSNFSDSQNYRPVNNRNNYSKPQQQRQPSQPLQKPFYSNNFNRFHSNFNNFPRQNNQNFQNQNQFVQRPQFNQSNNFNNQNFNRNSNNFKNPNFGQYSTNFNRNSQISRNTNFNNRSNSIPEPMDTSSGNTRINNHNLYLQNSDQIENQFENSFNNQNNNGEYQFQENNDLSTFNTTYDNNSPYQKQDIKTNPTQLTYFHEPSQDPSYDTFDNQVSNFRVGALTQRET
ncbi:hypothetical protein [Wolbachia endosymbiont of Psylliodes chrysocephala]|uniref:hypothetical protein n=1 Tax=Wolbachia endosymbiont of Psylliodes chrysocephala TaxID=2883236 RepID=UPI00209E2BC0|nr:hypothetical protein [Wolbachia endosymbiont of Psylliodes chrysocephala]